ncbi:aryl-alcohol dehydrogenase (NADP+) [Rhodococcus opacus M213]|uniref:Aryl-alcohol dehydrogenase (NADP+) n=1 Tax=Rhodococcus opacus M213 TaxID=1129896 RepID=K8XJ35_RHOOP|nr:aryl-alcohol dehydrogenase (NADP+) [Rhodococcus opacus M213]
MPDPGPSCLSSAPRRVEHLTDNIAGLEVTLSPEHLRTLDEVSAPTLNYSAPIHGEQRAMLQFAGTTVDGESSTVYPPLLQSDVRIGPGEVRTARSTPSLPAISAEPRES